MSTREKLWVVRGGDPKMLAEIVKAAGEDTVAIAEGRVFVGKKRALKDQPVAPGDAISIGPRVASPKIEVLFEKDGIVACIKPAGLPTVPDHAGASHALVALVEKQLGKRGLRVTSRLDREVSGVVLFAVDEAAEARLRDARAAGEYRRRYLAIAIGRTVNANEGDAGVWDGPIGRAKDPLLRRVDGDDAKPSITRWRKVAASADVVFLAASPETGRTHQIRVHAAHAGWPLVGDRDYGPGRLTLENGGVVAPARIALHAARVEVLGLVAAAPFPRELGDVWTACGGTTFDYDAEAERKS